MTAFREFNPFAFEGRAPDNELAEMYALAGVNEAWGDIPATGPVGPMQLAPAPRPTTAPQPRPQALSPRPAVANDPAQGEYTKNRGRGVRDYYAANFEPQDKRAILKDPRVAANLSKVYDLLGDLEHLADQQQVRMDDARLRMAHLYAQAARSPEDAAALRPFFANFIALMQAIQAGTAFANIAKSIESARDEFEYAGVATTPSPSSLW